MKKTMSLVSVLLALVLLFSCIPVAIAEETPPEPSYGESFLLLVESETRREYTAVDFPLVENLSYVNIVKMTPLETGYQYLLLMVLNQLDPQVLNQAKNQGRTYGTVYENYVAADMGNYYSSVELNYNTLELKVGETAVLDASNYNLAKVRYTISSVLFTVDSTLVDETALVESMYQDLGFIYIFAKQEPTTESWHQNTAAMGNSVGFYQGEVSPIHQYNGYPVPSHNIYAYLNELVKLPWVLDAQLYFEPCVYLHVMPSAKFSCEPQGIVSLEGYDSLSKTITALAPGETTITVKVQGGGTASATAVCKVTVVETPDPIPEPTPEPDPEPTPDLEPDPEPDPEPNPPIESDMDIFENSVVYGDVWWDSKIDAKDALEVLKIAVGKGEFNEKQLRAADFSYHYYKTEDHLGVDAKDALLILQFSVGTGPFQSQYWEAVPYVNYDSSNVDTYSWSIKAGQNSPFALCSTYRWFQNYMIQMGPFPEEWLSTYTPEFFETNSVFFYSGYEVSQGDMWTVESINKNGNAVEVNALYHAFGTAENSGRRLYHVEIFDPLKEIQHITLCLERGNEVIRNSSLRYYQ